MEHIDLTTTELFKKACESFGQLRRGEITIKEANKIASELGKDNKKRAVELKEMAKELKERKSEDTIEMKK